MKVGSVLKDLRNKKGKTQKEISKEMFIPYNTYRKYENNKIALNYWVIGEFAEYYRVSKNVFFFDDKFWGKPESLLTMGYLGAIFEIKSYKLDMLEKKINNLNDINSDKYTQLRSTYEYESKELRRVASILRRFIKKDLSIRKDYIKKHE